MKQFLCLILLIISCQSALAQTYGIDRIPGKAIPPSLSIQQLSSSKPIPVDQAFQFSATARDYQTILVMWKITPGYYLYRDRFHFRAIKPVNARIGQPILPIGQNKTSPDIGTYQVYHQSIRIPIPVISPQGKNIEVLVHYQGCSDRGYCYPPESRIVNINLAGDYMKPVAGKVADATVKTPTATPADQHDKVTRLLQGKSLLALIIGFFSFGVLLSLTPCVLPMIPILSGIIVGQKKLSTAHSFFLSLSYVLGMAITYSIAGVLFGFIGGSIQIILQKPWIIITFSFLFIAMALSLFGFYNLELPTAWRNKLAQMSEHQKRGTYFGVFMMGVLSTLILSPCVTAPLVGVLGYISQTGNATLGGIALFTMGLGMGLPLLIIGASSAKLLPKSGHWMEAIKKIMGVLMLAVAIWMIERIVPAKITMVLWAALAMGSAIAMGALTNAYTHWQRLRKALALIVFVYSIVLLIGAMMGNTNPLQPIHLSPTRHSLATHELHFNRVKSIGDVEEKLNIAKSERKIAVLDFYADWCIACKEMDAFTFSNRMVINKLKHYYLIRANVTANDATDKALLRHFSVVAPPTIIFFNQNKKEIKNTRIIGEMSATQFLSHLQKVEKANRS